MLGQRTTAAFGPEEAAAFAREYAARETGMTTRTRRQRTRRLARRIQAAWRAWQLAGRIEPL